MKKAAAKKVASKSTGKKLAAKTAQFKAKKALTEQAAFQKRAARSAAISAKAAGTPLRTINVKRDATDLFNPPLEVERVIAALGSNTVADLLGVSRSQPSRWRAGVEGVSPANRARLADLDYVLNRLLQVLWPLQAGVWLTAPNPHLGGRPVDVLAVRGAAPVIVAIDALAQGAYA